MNIKKNLIALSILICTLLSTGTTFTRGGWGLGVGAGIATGAIVGSSIAASNAAARDRQAAYYRDQELRRRDDEYRRREDAAERRHREQMDALRGSQNRRNPQSMDDNYAGE